MASERPRCEINKRVALGWHARLAVTLLCAGPWGVPGTGQGCRGYPAAASATSTGLQQDSLRLPAHWRLREGWGAGWAAGAGLQRSRPAPSPPSNLVEKEKVVGLCWSPSVATHWSDLGQTSLLPPSPGRIRTLGGGRAGPIEGRRPRPLQHGVWGRQRLLPCLCLRSHPRGRAPGRATLAPHH